MIAFSLPSLHLNYVYGILRNIILARTYLPDWTVWLYHNDIAVSQRIFEKYKLTGNVTFKSSAAFSSSVPVSLLPYLTIDDKRVKYFMVRSALSRISQRDATAVADWLRSDDVTWCVRDHPVLHRSTLTAGLIGFKTVPFGRLLNQSVENVLSDFAHAHPELLPNRAHEMSLQDSDFVSLSQDIHKMESVFLNEYILPRIEQHVTCFDSVHCDQSSFGGTSKPLAAARRGVEFIGEEFGAFEVPLDVNASTALQDFKRQCDPIT